MTEQAHEPEQTQETEVPHSEPVAAPAPRPASRWRGPRVPLVGAIALLLLGCFIGAGVTAVGAVAVAAIARHGNHVERVERPGAKWNRPPGIRGPRAGTWNDGGRRGPGMPAGPGGPAGPGVPAAPTPAVPVPQPS